MLSGTCRLITYLTGEDSMMLQSSWVFHSFYCEVLLILSLICLMETETCHALTDRLEEAYVQYDKNLRPPGDGPTEVAVDIYIISLSAVSEKTMDFTVNMYIRQRWTDKRLANVSKSTDTEALLITHRQDNTWMPDIFIKNDKVSMMSGVTTLNSFLRLNHQGSLLYSLRVTSTIACSMQLKRYPFDVQNCEVLFESYGHLNSEVRFKWKENLPVEKDEHIELPEHVLSDARPGNCTKTYDSTGTYSCISLIFVFERNVNYYIMGLFVPSVLIVVLSWVAFWIDKSSTPGRVSLSLLTILTMQNQMSSTLTQLPKVSYIKLVDVWLTGCLAFVFAGFLEYALVNKLTTELRDKQKRQISKGILTPNHIALAGILSSESAQEKLHILDHPTNNDTENGKNGSVKNRRWRKGQEMSLPDKVDFYSRFIFPFFFIIFNLVLWLTYLQTPDTANYGY